MLISVKFTGLNSFFFHFICQIANYFVTLQSNFNYVIMKPIKLILNFEEARLLYCALTYYMFHVVPEISYDGIFKEYNDLYNKFTSSVFLGNRPFSYTSK